MDNKPIEQEESKVSSTTAEAKQSMTRSESISAKNRKSSFSQALESQKPARKLSRPQEITGEAAVFLRASNKLVIHDAVAQAEWAEKKWVWIEHKEEGYIPGSIVGEQGDELTVELTDGKQIKVNINHAHKMNPPKFDKVEGYYSTFVTNS
jgi:hypothetical protein